MNLLSLPSRVFALGLAALTPLAFAETLNWTGNTGGSGSGMSTAANWDLHAPTAADDLIIATTTGNFSPIPTLTIGANYTIRSLTADNAAQLFNATLGLRIASATNNTVNTTRTLTFGTGGIDIITLAHGALVTFTNSTIAGNTPVTNINLGYSGSGTLRVDATSTLVLSNANTNVIGNGGLIKAGAGTLQLSGNHTYTGGFTLEEGKVYITTSGGANGGGTAVASSGFGTGTLTLKGGSLVSTTDSGRTIYNAINLDGNVSITSNVSGDAGNFTISTSAGQSTTLLSNSILNIPGTATTNNTVVGGQVTWNQAISGSASLTKTGAGTLVLNGTNTFTGGLNINAGTVTVDSPTALGSSAFNPASVVLNGGTLAFTAGSNATPSANRGFQIGSGNGTIDLSSGRNVDILGNIADVPGQSGQLIKTGTGTLTLSGTNSYSGSTTVQGGALVGNSTSLQGAIVLNNLSSVTFNQTTDGTYAGSLNGNGSFTKLGAGSLFLSNQSTHTGLNTVSQGALVLEGATLGGSSSAGLHVASGATLAGTGFINGNTTLDQLSNLAVDTYTAGTVTDRFGILTFNADLDISAAAGHILTIPPPEAILPLPFGAFNFDLGAHNVADLVVVNGLLSIGNGVLDLGDFNFTSGGTFQVGTYTLFTSSQAINGTLGGSLIGDFDGLTGKLSIAGNAIQLTLAGAPIPEPSTYAALLGLAVVGLALYRRRRC